MFNIHPSAATHPGNAVSLLIGLSIKATAVFLVASLCAYLLRGRSAAIRCLVWQGAIAAILATPVLMVLLPEWHVVPALPTAEPVLFSRSDPPPREHSPEIEVVRQDSSGSFEQPAAEPTTQNLPSAVQPHHTVPAAPRLILPEPEAGISSDANFPPWVIPSIWLTGTLFLFLRLLAARLLLALGERRSDAICTWSGKQSSRHSNPGDNPAIVPKATTVGLTEVNNLAMQVREVRSRIKQQFIECCSALSIRSGVKLLLVGGKSVPVVWGTRQCRLQLPEEAAEWSESQLKSALLHELAHIQRRDPMWQMLTQIAALMHWCNPLFWIAAWRMHIERERSCDDAVLQCGIRPSTYATHLLTIATNLNPSHWNYACGVAMAARTTPLEGRLLDILRKDCDRSSTSRRQTVLCAILVALTVTPLAALSAADPSPPPAAEGTTSDHKDEPNVQRGKNVKQISVTPAINRVRALTAAAEQSLNWSQPVNGLRAALARMPLAPAVDSGHPLNIQVVIQNVSTGSIRLKTSDQNAAKLKLAIRKNDSTLFRISSTDGTNRDLTLAPGSVTTLVISPEQHETDQAFTDLSNFTFYGIIEISESETGAWSGKLKTPDTSALQMPHRLTSLNARRWFDDMPCGTAITLNMAADKNLKWGKEVSGLKAALMIHSNQNSPLDLFVVLKNVSQSHVLLNDTGSGNKRTLYVTRNKKTQAGLGTQKPELGLITLKPNQCVVSPVFPPEPFGTDKRALGSLMAESAFRDQNTTLSVRFEFADSLELSWQGELSTAETSGNEAAVSIRLGAMQRGQKTKSLAGQHLSWGEASNGLRAALSVRRPPAADNSINEPDLFLSIQNISDAPILFDDSGSPGTLRRISRFRNGKIQVRTIINEPTNANVLLMPEEFANIKLVHPRTDATSKSTGQLFAQTLLKVPNTRLSTQLSIESAKRGAWVGKLTTGLADGTQAQGFALPESKNARALFQKWISNSRTNGMIPGGTISDLRKATSNLVEYNPSDKRTPQLKSLLKTIDVTHDWAKQDAIALLNKVTGVYDNLPSWAMELDRFGISESTLTGKPLPAELKDAPWGDASPTGLRAAWFLDPQAEQYRLNTPLKSRLLYHNTGRDTVVFRVLTWNQSSGHTAFDAAGNAIATNATYWTTIGQVKVCRLGPGEYAEVMGAGIGVGANQNQEDWRNTRVGTWIHANAGDEVTFVPDSISASGKDGRRQEVADDVWWQTFIQQNLQRHTPLPSEAEERRRIITRAFRELLGKTPTADEVTTFVGDKHPQAMSRLASRIAERTGTVSYSGTLSSGTTEFRVLPIDPEAAPRPRLATGPGRYQLSEKVQLVIVGRGDTHEVELVFSNDNGGQSTLPISVPDGRKTWAIAWKRDRPEFWIAERERMRHVQFPAADQMKERVLTPAEVESMPDRYRTALQPIFAAGRPPAADPPQ